MNAMTRRCSIAAGLAVLVLMIVACQGQPSPTAVGIATPSRATSLSYLVETDGGNEAQAVGNAFDITTDNCGSPTSAIESITRSRTFNVSLTTELSETLQAQLGADALVANAEIQAAISASLGIEVGASETIETVRQIETPPDTRSVVTLKWEELWQNGHVSIKRPDNTWVGKVPFRILTTMRLSQIKVDIFPCRNLTPTTPAENVDASLTTAPSPTEISAPTIAPATPTWDPGPTAAPSAPTEVPSKPPAGTVNATIAVDGYRTALGRSQNTEVYVQAGDEVSITYLYGEWWIGQGANCDGHGRAQTPTDAAGYLGRDGDRVEALIGCDNPNKCRPVSSAPWASLLGSIGENGGLFHIGKQSQFWADSSGILHLRMNYFNHNAVTGCPYGDGGTVTVQVNVSPP